MKVVILAGGSGTRLWPISRKSFPKQFLTLGGDLTLLQKTLKRFLLLCPVKDIVVVTNADYAHLVRNQLEIIDAGIHDQIIIEPERKNTTPAIVLAAKYFEEQGCDSSEVLVVASSDHIISPDVTFIEHVKVAVDVAAKDAIVTFGVRPHKPETGYGYIKIKESSDSRAYFVDRFVEKPSLETAQEYLYSGQYLWNCGIFVFTMGALWKELAVQVPFAEDLWRGSYAQLLERFDEMPSISIDYAVMEKAKNLKVIPLNLTWSDVGSWDSLYEALEKDENQNVKLGNIVNINTKNCLIVGGKRLISTIGLEDLHIVETEDALFIGKKGESQHVKALVDELSKKGMKEVTEHRTTCRPWGSYTVLEEGERYKVKRIRVEPHQKLSLQFHYHRSEHWVVVKGTALVRIGEKEHYLHENESIYVPKSTVHRLENPGKVPLEMMEVQVGEYVGEDDIVRLEDVYGRVQEPSTTA